MVHGCVIEDCCLIGINAVVLDGAVVRSGSLIAAGALVPPGKVVDGGLWAGVPARKVRDLTDDEKQMLIDNASNYVELKNMWKQAQS
jgi:carbonic anhydrase/acetyltransferase-like protein (isoleucine patch superfamily)